MRLKAWQISHFKDFLESLSSLPFCQPNHPKTTSSQLRKHVFRKTVHLPSMYTIYLHNAQSTLRSSALRRSSFWCWLIDNLPHHHMSSLTICLRQGLKANHDMNRETLGTPSNFLQISFTTNIADFVQGLQHSSLLPRQMVWTLRSSRSLPAPRRDCQMDTSNSTLLGM